MPKKPASTDYYRVAHELLPEMDESTRESVEQLLKLAETGVKTDNQIIKLISNNPQLKAKYRDLLSREEKTMGMNFSALAGDPPPPDARKFICPEPGCEITSRIQRIGDDPGMCSKHNVALIPEKDKKDGA